MVNNVIFILLKQYVIHYEYSWHYITGMFSNVSTWRISYKKQGKCFPFASTWIHPCLLVVSVLLIFLISVLCCVFCFVCFRPVSCVSNVVSVSGLSFLCCLSIFWRLFEHSTIDQNQITTPCIKEDGHVQFLFSHLSSTFLNCFSSIG
jgi:hypothetical protein